MKGESGAMHITAHQPTAALAAVAFPTAASMSMARFLLNMSKPGGQTSRAPGDLFASADGQRELHSNGRRGSPDDCTYALEFRPGSGLRASRVQNVWVHSVLQGCPTSQAWKRFLLCSILARKALVVIAHTGEHRRDQMCTESLTQSDVLMQKKKVLNFLIREYDLLLSSASLLQGWRGSQECHCARMSEWAQSRKRNRGAGHHIYGPEHLCCWPDPCLPGSTRSQACVGACKRKQCIRAWLQMRRSVGPTIQLAAIDSGSGQMNEPVLPSCSPVSRETWLTIAGKNMLFYTLRGCQIRTSL